jgi:hypothetical protein
MSQTCLAPANCRRCRTVDRIGYYRDVHSRRGQRHLSGACKMILSDARVALLQAGNEDRTA